MVSEWTRGWGTGVRVRLNVLEIWSVKSFGTVSGR